MLWASKRRKSRPDVLPSSSSKAPESSPVPLVRRSSLGSPRLPFAPLDPHQAPDMPDAAQNLYGRQILTLDEQQQVARQHSPSPPPNFSLPRRDPSSSSSGSGSSSSRRDTSDLYTTNSLSTFAFGPAAEPPSPGRGIGPLDEDDEDDIRRRGADETPRQSLADATRNSSAARRDPRTPAAYYTPSRSDAASHHTFGGSSASSLSSPSRSGSRSRTTSSTTHTSVDGDYLGGVTFNPLHHHPTLPPADVEFDSEEEEFSEEYDLIEVSSARGGGSIEGAQFEAAFERQMYSDHPLTARRPSLPMAIPGISPDDLAGASGSGRREREGSLATLRRPSRSLDDQVSVRSGSVDGPSPTTPVPIPAAQPVSVPETDGDWRSLSARAARAPSPMQPTLPTFAVPGGGPASAGGGSASFEGFGFDLDWSAMQAGITGLDMNDVAVHAAAHARASTSSARRPSQLSLMLRRPSTASGGSVMYDPDTFSAAVRGWGGEEYERQRKYWTFRRDAADGRGGTAAGGAGGAGKARAGAALSPVRSITSGRVGMGSSILSGVGGGGHGHSGSSAHGERPKYAPWRGMALNAEEIWNSSLVGSFKVRRIELRPQKPQQRVTIDPFRGPYTLGPKPPHDGAYTNIHKHSKVMAFSIHRHYKPARAPPHEHHVRGSGSVSVSGRSASASISGRGSVSGTASRGGGGGPSGAGAGPGYEERRRPTAMILLAPRHVQEAYTSTNTTKGLRSHGLLDEGRERDREHHHGSRDRERERERDTRSSGTIQGTRSKEKDRDRREREREKEREKEREREKKLNGRSGKSASGSKSQLNSTGSVVSAYRDTFPPPPPSSAPPPATHTYPPPGSDARNDFIGPSLAATRSGSATRRRRRDSLDLDDDDDSDAEQRAASSRTTHNEAFSTMDASSIDQMVLAQDARYGEPNGVLSRVLRRAPAHPVGPAAPHQVYIPPWVTLQSRVKQEERRRRHDVLSNSFEDVGLLPPKKSTGGMRAKKAPVVGVDIFAQVPSDALFMLLPLWPGPTDPVSERNATRAPHEIPTEQRQYLLVSYKPTDERAPQGGSGKASKHDGERKKGSSKGSSHSSPTSSADGAGAGRGCDILLTSYHISARLVSHADLQGSGVRVPDEGLAVLGPWHEAWLSMPQIATRDHGLLVIGTCASREAGVEFDPEGLVKMGLCIPVPPDVAADDGLQEEPVAELTPIGKAVLEMAWIGCVAVTSFGPAGSS